MNEHPETEADLAGLPHEELLALLRAQRARIAALEREVATLRARGWVVDGCGDDAWGDDPTGRGER